MRIHFVGIGGIGVSALAKYYLAQGWEVSGCDLAASEITEQLKKMGAKIHIGPSAKTHDRGFLQTVDKIIYSPAVPKTHPELLKTKNHKLKTLSYPEALGELTKTHYTIAISGTHGKSTTTAMLGLLLIQAGLNPTVLVGTKLKEFGNSNFRMGGTPTINYKLKTKNYLVVEADEHFASFLNYWPQIIVLTNIEADHLDYYKTLNNILLAFKKYVSRLPKGGILVMNNDDQNIKRMLISKSKFLISKQIQNQNFKIQTFSMRQKEAAKLRKILKVPGEHMVANALSALAAARALKIPDRISFKSLAAYRGAWRRFEIFDVRIKNRKVKIVSDYGHNPTKIKVTVEGARSKWPNKKIWLVYQPHQYARTFYLFKDFVKVLSRLPVQKLILTDIFDVAGREETMMKKKVSSQKLYEAILKSRQRNKNMEVAYIPDKPPFLKIEKYIVENLRGGLARRSPSESEGVGGEIVIIMGAGNVYALAARLTGNLKKEKIKT